jgi:diguanylate cyclase (GGDEF)-like protein
MKILIAEDDPVTLLSLKQTLTAWGYQIVTASGGLDAMRLLQLEDAPLLVIIDWVMPDMDGIDMCRVLRGDAHQPYRYLIVLTAKNDACDLVEAMQAGADDFISKPFNPEELRMRVRAGQRILELQAGLRLKAQNDVLTGLLNRGAILDVLSRDAARATRDRTPLTIMMSDLDNFKRINDQFGHQAGDDILRAAAQRCTEALRAGDVVGRYGGEEFLMVLPRCDTVASAQVAERVRDRIARKPVVVEGQPIRITISIGVATAATGSPIQSEMLIGCADAALYRAKAAGRNRVEFVH